jgi:hypothetical protein
MVWYVVNLADDYNPFAFSMQYQTVLLHIWILISFSAHKKESGAVSTDFHWGALVLDFHVGLTWWESSSGVGSACGSHLLLRLFPGFPAWCLSDMTSASKHGIGSIAGFDTTLVALRYNSLNRSHIHNIF